MKQRYTVEPIIGKRRKAEVELGQGQKVPTKQPKRARLWLTEGKPYISHLGVPEKTGTMRVSMANFGVSCSDAGFPDGQYWTNITSGSATGTDHLRTAGC